MKTFFISLLTLTVTFLQAQTAVTYKCDTAQLAGYFALPNKPSAVVKGKPGVVVLHAWMGITEHEKQTINKLAKLGYVALAADVYGAKVKPTNYQEAGQLSGYYKKNYLVYQARIKAAIEQLIKLGADPDKIVVIGFCFGGTGAIEAARARLPIRGVVSFHGGLGRDTLRPIEPMFANLLILHGADDPFVPASEVAAFQKEMRTANANWQMTYYSKAVHAFTDPAAGNDPSRGAAYNKEAAVLSWKAFTIFLERIMLPSEF
jgi:dienelactone hydrolase